jgi:hypothetical protein
VAQLETCPFEANSASELKNITATSNNNDNQCTISINKCAGIVGNKCNILSSIIVLTANNFGVVPLLHSVRDIIKTSKPDKMLTLLIN